MKKLIFVFGSNLQGIHGKGAALHAKEKYNAAHGVGIGRTGNAYAISTKKTPYETLPIGEIYGQIEQFKIYARINPNLLFKVTRIGCGYAGYQDSDIAPGFTDSPNNCIFDIAWINFIGLFYNNNDPRVFFNTKGYVQAIREFQL